MPSCPHCDSSRFETTTGMDGTIDGLPAGGAVLYCADCDAVLGLTATNG